MLAMTPIVAGCSPPAAPRAPSSAPADAPAPEAPRRDAEGTPPSLAPQGAPDTGEPAPTFDVPAISDDGGLVAVEAAYATSGRGETDIEFLMLSVATDSIVARSPLARWPQGRAELLTTRRWTPLTPYEDAGVDPAAPFRTQGVYGGKASYFRGEGMTVHYIEPTLTVRGERGRVLLQTRVDWTAGPWPNACGFKRPIGELGSVFGHRVLGALMVVVHYKGGTDICPEPQSTYHVARIPPSQAAAARRP